MTITVFGKFKTIEGSHYASMASCYIPETSGSYIIANSSIGSRALNIRGKIESHSQASIGMTIVGE